MKYIWMIFVALFLVIPIANACTTSPGVKCYDTNYYGYQFEDCSWGPLYYCSSCSDGSCVAPNMTLNITTNNTVSSVLSSTGDPFLIGIILLIGFLFGLSIIQAPIELYILVLVPLALIVSGLFMGTLALVILIPIALLVGFMLTRLIHR